MQGFSLIETTGALAVFAFGLLTAGRLLFVAASSDALAHSSWSGGDNSPKFT
jgi:sulfite exporter TauE/SafE